MMVVHIIVQAVDGQIILAAVCEQADGVFVTFGSVIGYRLNKRNAFPDNRQVSLYQREHALFQCAELFAGK